MIASVQGRRMGEGWCRGPADRAPDGDPVPFKLRDAGLLTISIPTPAAEDVETAVGRA